MAIQNSKPESIARHLENVRKENLADNTETKSETRLPAHYSACGFRPSIRNAITSSQKGQRE